MNEWMNEWTNKWANYSETEWKCKESYLSGVEQYDSSSLSSFEEGKAKMNGITCKQYVAGKY